MTSRSKHIIILLYKIIIPAILLCWVRCCSYNWENDDVCINRKCRQTFFFIKLYFSDLFLYARARRMSLSLSSCNSNNSLITLYKIYFCWRCSNILIKYFIFYFKLRGRLLIFYFMKVIIKAFAFLKIFVIYLNMIVWIMIDQRH